MCPLLSYDSDAQSLTPARVEDLEPPLGARPQQSVASPIGSAGKRFGVR